MATITKFEDLEIWQLSRNLNKDIYPFLKTLNDTKNYELQKQLDRSAGSIMDNIAEGFERDGNREFIQFLAISKASTGEVRSQLYRAYDRNLLEKEKFDQFQNDCQVIGNKIGKFITYLNKSTIKGKKFSNSNTK
ncbi:MAG: four helix bundle protein [Bacteroidia bacterium]|nr:four helix bundle protein [Bacteroidia bacterium]